MKLIKKSYVFILISIIVYWFYINRSFTDKEYYDNGIIKSETSIIGGELVSAIYYHENGKKLSFGKFENNKMNGKWILYDKEGKLNAKIMYKSGIYDGKVELYHKNLQIKESGDWIGDGKDSYRNGEHKWWYSNGNIKAIRNYDYGYEVAQKCWDESGTEIECDTVFFIYNIKNGLTDSIPLSLMQRNLDKSIEEMEERLKQMEWLDKVDI